MTSISGIILIQVHEGEMREQSYAEKQVSALKKILWTG